MNFCRIGELCINLSAVKIFTLTASDSYIYLNFWFDRDDKSSIQTKLDLKNKNHEVDWHNFQRITKMLPHVGIPTDE